jgi:hypothetical protein
MHGKHARGSVFCVHVPIFTFYKILALEKSHGHHEREALQRTMHVNMRMMSSCQPHEQVHTNHRRGEALERIKQLEDDKSSLEAKTVNLHAEIRKAHKASTILDVHVCFARL